MYLRPTPTQRPGPLSRKVYVLIAQYLQPEKKKHNCTIYGRQNMMENEKKRKELPHSHKPAKYRLSAYATRSKERHTYRLFHAATYLSAISRGGGVRCWCWWCGRRGVVVCFCFMRAISGARSGQKYTTNKKCERRTHKTHAHTRTP